LAGETFIAQNNGFGGVLSDVTNLIGEKHLRAFAGFGGEPALALMDAVV
jgi:hypothetical protein